MYNPACFEIQTLPWDRFRTLTGSYVLNGFNCRYCNTFHNPIDSVYYLVEYEEPYKYNGAIRAIKESNAVCSIECANSFILSKL